jgi:hypothetical protein
MTSFEMANPPQFGVYTILQLEGMCRMLLVAQGNLVGYSYPGYLGLPFNTFCRSTGVPEGY